MSEEDKVMQERMLALLERIAVGIENLSPASSYAFMEQKLPEVLERLGPLAKKFKRRAPVRADVLRKRMALRRRRAKKN